MVFQLREKKQAQLDAAKKKYARPLANRFRNLNPIQIEPSHLPDRPSDQSDQDLLTEQSTSWNPWSTAVQEDPWLPSMTKKQRLMGFLACLMGGSLFFSISLIYLPFILLKARKFALLFSLGSVFTMASFSLLWGPVNLLSRARLPFTVAYVGTLFGTIYVAMVLKSTLLTVPCAVFQLVALLWYVFSYVPGGVTGLKFLTKLLGSALVKKAENILPV
eukprot:sb/3469913/